MYAIAGKRGTILSLCFMKSKWVCVRISIYGSRWVLASLAVLGRLHWVDKEKLTNFILACQVNNAKHCSFLCSLMEKQDTETGGFADRPGDLPDPFHTLFGVAGLGLLGEERVKKV